MLDITKILTSLTSDTDKLDSERFLVKPSIKVDKDQFMQILTAAGNRYLASVGRDPNFTAPDYADKYYAWMCNADYKGITLSGPVGCGKTTMMRAFYGAYCVILYNYRMASAYLDYGKPIIVTGADMSKKIISDDVMPYLEKACIFVDDIGREATMIKDYGNQRHPITEWILQRERYAVPIFSTMNTDEKGLITAYGVAAADRLLSWTRILKVEGKSKR